MGYKQQIGTQDRDIVDIRYHTMSTFDITTTNNGEYIIISYKFFYFVASLKEENIEASLAI